MGVIVLVIDESNITKSVIKLSLPSVAEQALFMVVGVVSTILVGRISKEAISGVGLVNVLVNFIMVLFVALSTGCTVLVARLVGEEDYENAREAMKQSVVIGGITSLLVSLLFYIFAMPVMSVFFSRADSEVVRLAVIYFKITLYTFPLTLVNIIISGSLRGSGDTRTPMIIANIVNILNIGLGLILIFGLNLSFLKFEGYGIVGAAWAVALSRGIGGILSIAALYRRKNVISANIFARFRMNVEIVRRMLKVGIPAAMEQVIMQGGFLMLQVVISSMGTVAIAVYQIGMSVNSICFIPTWGFGIAATTLIGQSLGGKKPDIAEKCGWTAMKLSIGVISLLTIFIFIFARELVTAYSSDHEVIGIGAAAIRIFCISTPFLAVVVAISSALRGAGDIMYVMITSFVGIWGFRILMAVLLNSLFGLGIMSVWIALIFDFLIRSIMYFARFKRGNWKRIVI